MSGCKSHIAYALPENLISFFTEALKSFHLSKATFRVLCSLPPVNELAPLPAPSQPRFLLILDSSFNPPTLGHQRMAISAVADKRYSANSRLLLLLATSNADKAPKPAAFPQRLAMMYVFAQDLLSVMSSRGDLGTIGIDVAVTTEPYFHSKAKAVAASDFYASSAQNPEIPAEQVYLTGFDTLIRIFNPRYYDADGSMAAALDRFFARSRLRVRMRPDAGWGDAEEQRKYLDGLRSGGGLAEIGGRTEWAERVEMVDGRGAGDPVISSTKVRDAVAGQDWETLRTLVSDRVAEWIRKEGLYSQDEG
ncbi:hypothetical protein DL771_006392 [Monosporascus sp. 5C6A]|nr:hypothetical protein DL771_006392 [Monosporascus sp. 5C6A]